MITLCRERYQRLEETYRNDPFVTEGDFAERLLRLTEAIEERFSQLRDRASAGEVLSRQKVTELIYKHDWGTLRKSLVEYLQSKEDVWVLFDNVDKGWACAWHRCVRPVEHQVSTGCIHKTAERFGPIRHTVSWSHFYSK